MRFQKKFKITPFVIFAVKNINFDAAHGSSAARATPRFKVLTPAARVQPVRVLTPAAVYWAPLGVELVGEGAVLRKPSAT